MYRYYIYFTFLETFILLIFTDFIFKKFTLTRFPILKTLNYLSEKNSESNSEQVYSLLVQTTKAFTIPPTEILFALYRPM